MNIIITLLALCAIVALIFIALVAIKKSHYNRAEKGINERVKYTHPHASTTTKIYKK